MNPPRVLMTADAVGGVWTYAVDVAAGLAGRGVVTTLVVFGPSPSEKQATSALAIPGLSLIDTNLPLDWMASEPAEILECAAALRGLARGGRADLIHLNSPALAALGGFSAPVLGACHSCLATWWSAVRDGPMPGDFRWRTQALWKGLLACDALAAPSVAFSEAVAHAYEIPRPLVVHNGRRPEPASPPRRRSPKVITTGRLWDDGKNIAVLDDAAAWIGAPVLAAGPLEGPNGERRALRHARALGRLSASDVAVHLARAPVFASSALYEPFGLGVLEAAQAGCALVLSDIPTFRELWEGAAVFADPRDPEAFAEACNRLLADPAWSGHLGRVARRRSQRFGPEATASALLGIYRQLAPDRFALPGEAEEVAA